VSLSLRRLDDFPASRQEVPSGKMDRLPDGAHRMPDLRGQADYDLGPLPELRTRKQKKRAARDRAILKARKQGLSLREIGDGMNLHHTTILKVIRKDRARRKAAEMPA
jgi:DNA-binding NarL/FixJ family response regulator